ncbi:MAG: hypothetical protein KUG65_08355 [Sphingomonadaceae bacterium]|nr:hypothetical protein [Sphingomonadaceae bacterium]
MARFDFIVLSRCTPGKEKEFEDWYINQHLVDVCKIDGVVGARITQLQFQKVYELDAPQWGYLTFYTLDCDDPQPILDEIDRVKGTDEMPLSPYLNREGLLQAIGKEIGSYP